jgi:hypothetical protein
LNWGAGNYDLVVREFILSRHRGIRSVVDRAYLETRCAHEETFRAL